MEPLEHQCESLKMQFVRSNNVLVHGRRAYHLSLRSWTNGKGNLGEMGEPSSPSYLTQINAFNIDANKWIQSIYKGASMGQSNPVKWPSAMFRATSTHSFSCPFLKKKKKRVLTTPGKYHPTESWLSSRSLTSLIVLELVFPSWHLSLAFSAGNCQMENMLFYTFSGQCVLIKLILIY